MRQILSSIDIGRDFIKFIIGEYSNDRFYVLCAVKTPSCGIENGKIIEREKLLGAIKKCVMEACSKLGIELNKVILSSNFDSTKIKKNVGEIKITNEDKIILGKDVVEVLNKCAQGQIDNDYTILETVPIDFGIQGDVLTKNPNGCESEVLAAKALITEARKDEVDAYLGLLSDAGLKVIDIVPSVMSDYYNFKSMERDNESGVLINIGYEFTSISICHKGNVINHKCLKLGALNVIEDIAYIKMLDFQTAKELYNTYTIANSQLANTNNYRIVNNIDGNEIKIYQYELAEIAESRIVDMLEIIKKQINILTKKEISYIIVSGGLTELKDAHLTISNVIGPKVKIGNINDIGARDNSYVSAIGALKYFHYKLALREQSFSIFADKELELVNSNDKLSGKDNGLLNKVFGYFFDS